jgi:hypothetical protein
MAYYVADVEKVKLSDIAMHGGHDAEEVACQTASAGLQ